MSEKKKIEETSNVTRRAFLKYSAMGMVIPTVIGVLPNMPIMGEVGWKAYAQSQSKISNEWWQVASKYGKPTGKFGEVGSPVTLTIGYQPLVPPYWTSVVNKQAGLIESYLPKGSKVVWFRSLTGPLINNNMLAGKNQFGFMAETPGLRSGDTVPCDMVACVGYDVGEIGSVFIRSDLFKEGKFKEPKDLDGQPMGVPFGSFLHRQAVTFNYENNIKPKLLDLAGDIALSNMESKNTIGGWSNEPYSILWEKRGVGQTWLTGQDMPCTCNKYDPQSPKHTFRVVGVLLSIFEWLRDRPDIIGAFLKAEEEARDMLHNNPDLATYYISTDISDIPAPVIRYCLDMMVWDGRITPGIRNHLKGVARMWKDVKILREDRSADPDKFIDEWADDRYLRLAIKELKANGQWTSDKLPGFPKEVRPDQLKRHSLKTYENMKFEKKPWKPTRA